MSTTYEILHYDGAGDGRLIRTKSLEHSVALATALLLCTPDDSRVLCTTINGTLYSSTHVFSKMDNVITLRDPGDGCGNDDALPDMQKGLDVLIEQLYPPTQSNTSSDDSIPDRLRDLAAQAELFVDRPERD